MKYQIKEALTKFVTIRTEEQKRRVISCFLFGGLCGLMSAIGGLEYFALSLMFAATYVLAIIAGYKIYCHHQHKEPVKE